MRHRLLVPHHDGHINVTPMIDVVMCLIVFYLIVGRLASGQMAPVDLPDSRAGRDEQDPAVLVINLAPPEAPTTADPSPLIIVEGQTLPDAAALEAHIRQKLLEHPDTVIQIRGSRRLTYGQVRPHLLACARAGAPTVELAAERIAP